MLAEQSSFLLALLIILISFVIYVVLCPLFIKLLAKLSWRETLKTDNADLHAHKAGTYTSGGLLIVSVVSIMSLIIGYDHSSIIVDLVISVVLFSFVGLIDDALKIRKGYGLRKSTKMGLLVLASVITMLIVPMYQVNTLFSALFALFIIVGTSNSVNLTDGVDGLATSICIIVLIAYSHDFDHRFSSALIT